MATSEQLSLGRMEVKILSNGNVRTYIFQGGIDESFSTKKIPKYLGETVVFNMGGVKFVNSCGIKEWILFIRDFAASPSLTIEECPVVMVDQFNIVPQTLGNAHIESFFAPYYCPTCEEEVSCLIKTSDHYSTLISRQAPQIIHSCGTILDFDALEDCYFGHLGQSQKAG